MSVQKIGRYEILRELGRGGMATVYLARDPSFERDVALKVLPAHLFHDIEFRKRFAREAKIITALEHPYIVPIYQYDESGAEPFIVMRYLSGGTLSNRLAGKPLSLIEALPILRRLAEALEAAHAQHIVHRDLKPANVLFDSQGDAFLTDFGVAKMMEASTLTLWGTVGTPAYMSPEQAQGDQELDSRSDVYGLGILVRQMLTGESPYASETSPLTILYKIINEPFPPLEARRLGLPAAATSVLARALAKNPASRYPTVGAFAEALSTLQTRPQ